MEVNKNIKVKKNYFKISTNKITFSNLSFFIIVFNLVINKCNYELTKVFDYPNHL